MLGVESDVPWFVAIVTPINDVIAPLYKSVLLNTVITVLILLFGVILASLFSASLSRPIKALAQMAFG